MVVVVVVVMVVVVVERLQLKCGGGGGGGKNRILWPENLYKCATIYLFLSLHFAPEELT